MPHVIIHFEIPADDVDRARRFYGGLFGWTFQDRRPLPGEGAAYVLIDCGGRGPNGALMRRSAPGQGLLNYFSVENLDEYTRKAVALGGNVVATRQAVPGLGWWAVFRDPDGNAFALWQDDPGSGHS